MKHIKVYQTLRNTTTIIINNKRHGNVSPASMKRLSQIVMTEQMLGNCNVTPNYPRLGWTATVKEK